jgi:hypothetical protein
MEEKISKFQNLNFNLKNLIFSYLNILEILPFYNLNRTIRIYFEKHHKINEKVLKIFLFLHNLQNFKNYRNFNTNIFDRLEKDHYINYYEECSLFSSVFRKFTNYPREDVINALILYVNGYCQLFNFRNLKLNFNDWDEIQYMQLIVPLLNKEKFIYYVDPGELDFEKDENDLLFIFKKIKFVNFLTSAKGLFIFLNKNKIELNFKRYVINYKDILHEKNSLGKVSMKNYFESFSNHSEYLDWEDVTEDSLNLDSNHQGNFDSLDLIKNNTESIKLIDNLNSKNLDKFDKLYPNGLKNLKKIIINPDYEKDINFESIIFKRIAKLEGLYNVPENVEKFIRSNLNIEKLGEVRDSIIRYLKCTQNIKKIELYVLRTTQNLSHLLNLKNLKQITIRFPNNSVNNDTFLFDKFFKLSSCTKTDMYIFKNLFTNIISNNGDKIKNCYVKTSSVFILNLFVNFLISSNLNYLLDEIKAICVTDRVDDITLFIESKIFKHLNYLEIHHHTLIPLVNYVESLDKIYLNYKISNWNDGHFNLLKDKRLKMIKIFIILSESDLIDYLMRNLEHFKLLLYLSYFYQNGTKIKEDISNITLKFNFLYLSNKKLKINS